MQNISFFRIRFFLLLFLFSSFVYVRAEAQCNDSLTLVDFYQATGGINWAHNENWLEPDQSIGNWYGITVDENGCVTRLALPANDLNGEIPYSLTNLSQLHYLNIRGGELSPVVLSGLGALSMMDSLLVTGSLGAEIPAELAEIQSLKLLFISNGKGSIPKELGSLSNLRELLLFGEEITGNIPPELGNLTNLYRLWIVGTSIDGVIPAELGGLSNLEDLYLGDNRISGSIPPELGNLQNLKTCRLDGNQLEGSIPSELANMSELLVLYLFNNRLTGVLPASFEHLTVLKDLRISYNQLTGIIPAEFANITNLRTLDLRHNRLSGELPVALANLSALEGLSLDENQLIGGIPAEYGNFSNLKVFTLSSNMLSGALPPRLGDLINLEKINLSDNNFEGCFPFHYTTFCDINYADFENNPALAYGGDFNAFCAGDPAFGCPPIIQGRVVFDENQDCIINTSEIGLQGWTIKAGSLNGDFWGLTNVNGDFGIHVFPEEYEVETIAPSGYWEVICPQIPTTTMVDTLVPDTLNFFAKALIDCPYMTTDISTSFLRPCFSSVYTVNYCNEGTIASDNTYIKVSFDDLITVDSASINISSVVDNAFIFDLGDVAVNECGSFSIYTTISCDAVLGQALCANAHIYPDAICAEISPEWSGATVEVQGSCEGDEVHFIIKNTGEGDMLQNRSYIIVEDGLILMSEPVPFILNASGDMDITLPANGSTYVLQAMQVENHPLPSMPTAFVEGCGTNDEGGFSTGYVTQLPEDDAVPFVSIDCQEVTSSYDPNDKRAYPKGYGDEYYIERGQDIEYHIRFQNTGTDTAFTVIVEDVLSQNLERTSFRRGASSHPYRVEIAGEDTLRFIFENILLPDSLVNEPASHGFVKFRISQKGGLDVNTQIANTADIYFDYNDPVRTNTTLHTIGEHFIAVATEKVIIPDLKVSIAPNPMINQTIIRIDGTEYQEAQLRLYNTLGGVVQMATFNKREVLLKRSDLSPGIYFFDVLLDGQKGFIGKLVVE